MHIEYWTYNGNVHCINCARHANMTANGAIDGEGNEPHPGFDTDEGPLGEDGNPVTIICDTCWDSIREPYKS